MCESAKIEFLAAETAAAALTPKAEVEVEIDTCNGNAARQTFLKKLQELTIARLLHISDCLEFSTRTAADAIVRAVSLEMPPT